MQERLASPSSRFRPRCNYIQTRCCQCLHDFRAIIFLYSAVGQVLISFDMNKLKRFGLFMPCMDTLTQKYQIKRQFPENDGGT